MEDKGFKQDNDTLALLKMYHSLKKEGKIPKSDKELCAMLNFATSSFTLIKKGQRNAPEWLIDAFLKKFKLTREALQITSKEFTYNSQPEITPDDYSWSLKELVDQLQSKDATIKQLINRIDLLTDHIIKLTGDGDRDKSLKKPIPT